MHANLERRGLALESPNLMQDHVARRHLKEEAFDALVQLLDWRARVRAPSFVRHPLDQIGCIREAMAGRLADSGQAPTSYWPWLSQRIFTGSFEHRFSACQEADANFGVEAIE